MFSHENISLYLVCAQLTGFIALGVDLYATLLKDDARLVFFHAVGSAIFAIHFFMLGAVTGALTELINIARAYISIKNRTKYWGVFFCCVFLSCLFVLSETLWDTLPFVASIFSTVAIYFFSRIKMRFVYFCGFVLWLVYSYTVFSLGGIVWAFVMMGTTATTIYRLHRDHSYSLLMIICLWL